jgi:glucosamine-6-phosphate deaminase
VGTRTTFSRGNEIDRNRDVWQYLDGVAAHDEDDKAEGCARRMLRNLVELMDLDSLQSVDRCVAELAGVLHLAHPGKKTGANPAAQGDVVASGGRMRLGLYWLAMPERPHLRLGFYTGDIFTKEPTLTRDVPPSWRNWIGWTRCDHRAFDPEASGTDTHYKVMQAWPRRFGSI